MTMTEWSEAGQRGNSVRSDCWIRYKPAEDGGYTIELSSKVEAMYGNDIRKQVSTTLSALGIKHANIQIEDAGALPFVIAARVETAVRRFHTGLKKSYNLPFKSHCLYQSKRERFRRSRLYLPGNEPKFFLNAGVHQPDGIILDLEDSVSVSEKDAARILVRNALRQLDFFGSERMVRINQLPQGLEDLKEIISSNVHLILIPKCEQADHVKEVAAMIKELTKDAAEDTNNIYLMPIIESALGAINAFAIASADPMVVALTIGLEDYTADLGVQRTKDGKESFWARCQVVNAARAAGVQPIDTVFSDVADSEGLYASVLEAKALGFDGKGCIHPRQISIIHDAFAPSEKEIERAKKIVVAFDEAQKQGLSVVSLGRKMIDPPVVKRALRIVEIALATGILSENWKSKVSDGN